MVLRRPLITPLTGLLNASEKAMHRTDRTQITLPLKQALINLCRWLITVVFAVQRINDGSAFLRTQCSRLY